MTITGLVAQPPASHKRAVSDDLFDLDLRARRRDRAFRCGPELFLHERAFDDICERISFVNRRFRSALLLGCPDPAWVGRLGAFADIVEAADPGPLFAAAAGGSWMVEDRFSPPPAQYDLCVTIGCLDTVNDLPGTLLRLRYGLGDDALLIGAVAGGDSAPMLRAAMREADAVIGVASPHVHPRLEPAALAGLLTAAGYVAPVVDIDRMSTSFPSLNSLVRDLRRMGATNILTARSRRGLSRIALAAARRSFDLGGNIERFELLHFAAWTPPVPQHG